MDALPERLLTSYFTDLLDAATPRMGAGLRFRRDGEGTPAGVAHGRRVTVLLSDWRVITRRWYVVVAGLGVTVLMVFGAMAVSPAQYEASSTFLLLPPKSVVDGKLTNPYLNLGGLDGMADVISTAMTDKSVGDALSAGGVQATYEITRDFTIAGPVLNLDVRADSSDEALKAQMFLLNRVPATLSTLQTAVSVDKGSQIVATTVTQDTTTSVNRKDQIRLLLVALVIGLGGTYLTAAVLDGILRGRRKNPIGAAMPLTPPLPAPPQAAPVGSRQWQ